MALTGGWGLRRGGLGEGLAPGAGGVDLGGRAELLAHEGRGDGHARVAKACGVPEKCQQLLMADGSTARVTRRKERGTTRHERT